MGGLLIFVGLLVVLAGTVSAIRSPRFLHIDRRLVGSGILAGGFVVLVAGGALLGSQPEPPQLARLVADEALPKPTESMTAMLTPRPAATARPTLTPIPAQAATPTAGAQRTSTLASTEVPTSSGAPQAAPAGPSIASTPSDPFAPIDVGISRGASDPSAAPVASAPSPTPSADEPSSSPTTAALPTVAPTPQPSATQPAPVPPSPTAKPSATPPPPTRTPTKPAPTRTSTPLPPTSTPVPTSGANMSCNQVESVQICAWVSNSAPGRSTKVTVTGRLVSSGAAQSGLPMRSTWHYKSSTSGCEGSTNANGIASCERSIGGATLGYAVAVDVEITYGGKSYKATTSFTPQ